MIPLLIARSIYHNSIVLIQFLLLVHAGLPRAKCENFAAILCSAKTRFFRSSLSRAAKKSAIGATLIMWIQYKSLCACMVE